MNSQIRKPIRSFGLVVGSAIWLCSASAPAAVTLTTLATFSNTNQLFPTTLIQTPDGNFYGTSRIGNSFPPPTNTVTGSFFRMNPAGDVTTLAYFWGTNGTTPNVGLLLGADGNIYGTTSMGGPGNWGTIFRATTNGVLTVMASFNGTNGAVPVGPLVQTPDGNFYGVTRGGGPDFDASTSDGYGTAFRMASDGTLTTLAVFNGTNGWAPVIGPILGRDGNMYGTTPVGGVTFVPPYAVTGNGTIYKLTTNGVLTSLASFNGTNGHEVENGLIEADDGGFFGTTIQGGPAYDGSHPGSGSVFRTDTNGTITSLYLFTNGVDGGLPTFMTKASDGNLYGVQLISASLLFQVTPAGSLTILQLPAEDNVYFTSLIQGSDGNFYGTTQHSPNGTIVRLSIPLTPLLHVAAATGDTISLNWNSVADLSYQLQYSTDLGTTNWNNLGSSVTATNGTMSASDPIGSDAQRFYRVVLLP